MPKPDREFERAVQAFHAGQQNEAKQICQRLIKRKRLVADAAHMLALIYKQEGDLEAARGSFNTSLSANPKQGAVLSNYANLLAALGEPDEANATYQRATRVAPEIADAWHNWGVLLNKAERFDDTVQRLSEGTRHHPGDPRLYLVLGIALRALERLEESVGMFEKILTLVPSGTSLFESAYLNKALSLRELNRPSPALDCVEMAMTANEPNTTPQHKAENLFLKGCLLYDTGDLSASERVLKQTLSLNPAHIGAHEALNKLYWEQDQLGQWLASYRTCIPLSTRSPELRYSYASQLVWAGQEDEARQVLEDAVHDFGPEPQMLHALGALEIRRHNLDEARRLIELALEAEPNATRFLIDRANLHIQEEDYAQAMQHLENAGKVAPLNQEIWAYKGLCWRLTGDERANWLNDYDHFVDARYLPVPEGYDNLEHFLFELRTVLTRLHRTNRQPLDQSVRNGTQTVGRLLALDDKVVKDYRSALSASIQEFLDELPDDPTHPFLGRNLRNFVYSGSWSVRLGDGGFHANHMHPAGWLSNCTYITVPEEVSHDDPDRAGWIKFGETSLALGDRDLAEKVICPKEGLRVLFPSYFWHGTYPFKSGSFRVTLPTDISPARGANKPTQ